MQEDRDQMDIDCGGQLSSSLERKSGLQQVIYVKKLNNVDVSASLLRISEKPHDPQLQVFLEKFAQQELGIANEVEEILLSQNRENFSTLSVQEFFKLQNFQDIIAKHFEAKYLKLSSERNSQILDIVQSTCMDDKIDILGLLVENAIRENHKKDFVQTQNLSKRIGASSNLFL
mmetsp:Transcript_42600/g.40867  ORF Transcript_42600/g.40867 Transcript_42600/m.40867 type:complete len:174 (+) Transcript_42600:2487-3008(+)